MKILINIGKGFLYLLLGILILLFVAGLFIDPIAKKLLKSQVNKAAGGQYSLVLEDLDVSLLGGDFSLKGVLLKTDTTDSDVPPIALLEADKIKFSDISWLSYIMDKRLSIGRAYFDQLNAKLLARTVDSAKQQSAEEKPFRLRQLDIYPAIKKQIDRFHLKDLSLNNISLTLINLTSRDTLKFNSKRLDLKSDDILIDADKLITDSRAFYATEINFTGKKVKVIRSGNKNLIIETDYINFETNKDQIGLQSRNGDFLQIGNSPKDTLLSVAYNKFLLSDLGMKKIQEDSIAQLKNISVDSLVIVNNFPTDTDNSSPNSSGNSDQQQQSFANWNLGFILPVFIREIDLKEFDLNNITYIQGADFQLKRADLFADDVVINKNSAFAQEHFLHARALNSNIDLIAFSVRGDSVRYSFANFSLEAADGLANLHIQEVKLKPAERSSTTMWLDAALGKFTARGINTKGIPRKNLEIDSIAFSTPEIAFHLPQRQNKNNGATAEREGGHQLKVLSLYPAIEDVFDSLYLRKLALVDAEIRASGLTSAVAEELYVPSLYLQLTDLLIADSTAFEGRRVLHADDIALRLEDMQLPVSPQYTAELDLLRLSTREKFLEAEDFKYTFIGDAEKVPVKADTGFIMNLQNDRFLLRQIDWQDLFKEQELNVGLIQTERLDLMMFSEENTGTSHNKKQTSAAADMPGASMPQQAIKQLEVPFYIDGFALHNGSVTYKELAKEAEKPGIARVTNISITAENITNIPGRLKENPILSIEIEGKLMGTGEFYTDIKMDMVSDSNLISITGQIDTFNITRINSFTEYTSPIGFKSGKIYQLGWDIETDDELAKGILKMKYDNLDIRLSEGNSADTSGLLKNVGSFLANTLVLESDVTAESGKKPEKAKFKEEREGKDFPAYLIEGLISGFMDLVVTVL